MIPVIRQQSSTPTEQSLHLMTRIMGLKPGETAYDQRVAQVGCC